METTRLYPRKGKGRFGKPAQASKDKGDKMEEDSPTKEEGVPNPVTPTHGTQENKEDKGPSKTSPKSPPIPRDEGKETPISGQQTSFHSPNPDDPSKYKGPPGHTPDLRSRFSNLSGNTEPFSNRNKENETNKNYYKDSNSVRSSSMSTTSAMNEIPPLPDDFLEVPSFLVANFASVLPTLHQLQSLIFDTLRSHTYDALDENMRLGRSLKHYIGSTHYNYHLDSIIQLRVVWEFLYARSEERLNITPGSPVSFSHFLRYKATSFGTIAAHYKKETPPYKPHRERKKSVPPNHMPESKEKVHTDTMYPDEPPPYVPTSPTMVWSDHHTPAPGYASHEADVCDDDSSMEDSTYSSFHEPSIRGFGGGRGRGGRGGRSVHSHHSQQSFHSSYAPTKSFDYFPPNNPARSYVKHNTHRVAKARSTMNQKITWDGHRQTFDAYKNQVEGHLLQVGAGYLTNQSFLDAYAKEGPGFFHDPRFYEDFGISIPQARWDKEYLYGILKSSLKCHSNPHLTQHNSSKDGIRVWIAYVLEYSNNGSNAVRIRQLESQLLVPYNSRQHKDVPSYVDDFQTVISELEGLYLEEQHAGRPSGSLSDTQKKNWLLNGIAKDPHTHPLIQQLRRETHLSYEQTAHDLRTQTIQAEFDLNPAGNSRRAMLGYSDMGSDTESMSTSDAIRLFHALSADMGYAHAYASFQSPTYRESLKIPTSIWRELSDKLKEEVNAIRKR
jgi:hypothetical protein